MKKLSLNDKLMLLVSATVMALVFLLAMMGEGRASEPAVLPSSFASLQPFKSFPKGAGEGVAYRYEPRTKAQFVALLRDKELAKKEMRASCEVLIRQMMEGHKNLPFEGCEGTAAAIEDNDDFTVVACRDEMFRRENWLAVTNEGGSAFGVWHRKCLPNEQVLVYKNQPLISLTCLNVAIPVTSSSTVTTVATTVPSTSPVAGCPKGIALIVNAWTMESLPSELRKRAEELIAAAAKRDSKNASNAEAYKPDALSRTLGDDLIRVVNVRAPVGADIKAQLLDPKTLEVVEDLGVFRLIDGIVIIPLSKEQRTKIVQTIWPAWFSSPTVSGALRRLWFFPKEWEKKEGGKWCTMNEHGIYKKENKP